MPEELLAPPSWDDVEKDESYSKLTPEQKSETLTNWAKYTRQYGDSAGWWQDKATQDEFSSSTRNKLLEIQGQSEPITGASAGLYGDSTAGKIAGTAVDRVILGMSEVAPRAMGDADQLLSVITRFPELATGAIDKVYGTDLTERYQQANVLGKTLGEMALGEQARAQEFQQAGKALGGGPEIPYVGSPGDILQEAIPTGFQAIQDIALTGGSGSAAQVVQPAVRSGLEAIVRNATTPVIKRVAGIAGGEQLLAQLNQGIQERMDRGESMEDAQINALPEAALTGISTAVFTSLGGMTGAESILKESGVKGLKNRVTEVLKEGLLQEAPEEMADQAAQGIASFISKEFDPSVPKEGTIGERFAQSVKIEDIIKAGVLGAIVGFGATTIGQASEAIRDKIIVQQASEQSENLRANSSPATADAVEKVAAEIIAGIKLDEVTEALDALSRRKEMAMEGTEGEGVFAPEVSGEERFAPPAGEEAAAKEVVPKAVQDEVAEVPIEGVDEVIAGTSSPEKIASDKGILLPEIKSEFAKNGLTKGVSEGTGTTKGFVSYDDVYFVDLNNLPAGAVVQDDLQSYGYKNKEGAWKYVFMDLDGVAKEGNAFGDDLKEFESRSKTLSEPLPQEEPPAGNAEVIPPAGQQATREEVLEESQPSYDDLSDYVFKNHPQEFEASKYLDPTAQYNFHLKVWEAAGKPATTEQSNETQQTTPLNQEGTQASEAGEVVPEGQAPSEEAQGEISTIETINENITTDSGDSEESKSREVRLPDASTDTPSTTGSSLESSSRVGAGGGDAVRVGGREVRGSSGTSGTGTAERERLVPSPVKTKLQQGKYNSFIEKKKGPIDERISKGATLEVVTPEDFKKRALIEQEFDTIKGTAPIGNPNHPQTVRMRELKAQLAGEIKKTEYRLVSPDGTFVVLSPMEAEYADIQLSKNAPQTKTPSGTVATESSLPKADAGTQSAVPEPSVPSDAGGTSKTEQQPVRRVQLKGAGPQTYEVVRPIPQTTQERELGEQYYEVKNERDGSIQTIEAGDVAREIKPKSPKVKKAIQKLPANQRAKAEAATEISTEADPYKGAPLTSEAPLEVSDNIPLLNELSQYGIFDEGATGNTVLQKIADNPKEAEWMRVLARQLLALKLSTEVQAVNRPDSTWAALKSGSQTLFNLARRSPGVAATALHEISHHATLEAIRNPESLTGQQRKAYDRLSAIYEQIRALPEFQGEYGQTSLEEMVAEAFSNAGFRAKLQRVGENQSLWKRFVRAIAGILSGRDVAQGSLLEQAVEAAFTLAGAPIVEAPSVAASQQPARVTPEQDAEYLAAVESGDVAKQQVMVDEAAKNAVDSVDAYDIEEDWATKPGEEVERVVWGDVGDTLKVNGAGSLGFNSVKGVNGVHFGDADYWIDRLEKDYDRNPEEAKRVLITMAEGDRIVDDPQYATDPNTGEKATSGVLLTARPELRRGIDFRISGEDYNSDDIPASSDPVIRDSGGKTVLLSERFNSDFTVAAMPPRDRTSALAEAGSWPSVLFNKNASLEAEARALEQATQEAESEKEITEEIVPLTDAQRGYIEGLEDPISMAKFWARKFSNIIGTTYDDRVSEGIAGLVKAAQTFNPERGTFVQHANNSIKQALLGYKRSTETKGRDYSKTLSANAPIGEEDGGEFLETMTSGEDMTVMENEQVQLRQKAGEALVGAMSRLSDRDRSILRDYASGMNLRDVGAANNVTAEGARKIIQRARDTVIRALQTRNIRDISEILTEPSSQYEIASPTRAAKPEDEQAFNENTVGDIENREIASREPIFGEETSGVSDAEEGFVFDESGDSNLRKRESSYASLASYQSSPLEISLQQTLQERPELSAVISEFSPILSSLGTGTALYKGNSSMEATMLGNGTTLIKINPSKLAEALPENIRQTLEEEIIHVIDLQSQWIEFKKSGLPAIRFSLWQGKHAEDMLNDMSQELASVPETDKKQVLDALVSSYNLYNISNETAANETSAADLINRLNQNVGTNIKTGSRLMDINKFLHEFARQIVQMRRNGQITEETTKTFLQKISDWIKRGVEAIRNASSIITKGSLQNTKFGKFTNDLLAIVNDKIPPKGLSDVAPMAQREDFTAPVEAPAGRTAPSEGQPSGVRKAFDHIRDIGLWAKNSTFNLPKFTDFKKALLNWVAKNQQSSWQINKAQRGIESAVPKQIRREAITNWIQAGGDKALLQERARQTKNPERRKAYEYATELTPDELKLAQKIRETYDHLLQVAKKYGIDLNERENYVNQLWRRNSMGSIMGSSQRLSGSFKFSKERVFDSFFEGEQAGYEPVTKDISKLLPIYMNELNNAINSREFVKALSKGKASDGRPLLSPRGSISEAGQEDKGKAYLVMPDSSKEDTQDYRVFDQPALHSWLWKGKDEAGNPIMLKSDLAVHPEVYSHLKKVIGEQAEPDTGSVAKNISNAIWKGLCTAQSYAKQTMLSFSPFHMVQEGIHAVGHRINPLAIPAINLDDPKQLDAAQHGLMLSHDRMSAAQFMEGVGSGERNLVTLAMRKFGGDAGAKVSAIIDSYQHWLFEKYIPALKYKTYEAMVDRNSHVYASDMAKGTITMDQVKNLSAQQANAAYGHLNYAEMGRSKTMQNIWQTVLLAPDFLEARVRFALQAGKGLVGSKSGREQLLALGFLAAAQFIAARIANKLNNDDYHWDHPFEVRNGNKWYGVRSVPEDLFKLWNDPRAFIYGRMSPIVSRGAIEGMSGVNYRGEPVELLDTLKSMAANTIPLPFQALTRGITPQTRANPISPIEQLMSATGMQVKRYSPINEARKLARDWMQKNEPDKVKKVVYPVSKYQQLRYALDDNNMTDAVNEIRDLLNDKKVTIKDITSGFHNSISKPWTKNAQTDKEFAATLTGHDKEIFDAAVQRRKDIAQRFDIAVKEVDK